MDGKKEIIVNNHLNLRAKPSTKGGYCTPDILYPPCIVCYNLKPVVIYIQGSLVIYRKSHFTHYEV